MDIKIEHIFEESPQNTYGYLKDIPFDKIQFNSNCDNAKQLICNIFFTTHTIDTSMINSINSKSVNKSGIIPSKRLRWWINVPVNVENNKTIWIKMLADSAADKPCMNLYWAYKHFRNFITKDHKPTTLSTPNGETTPKYCVYLSFPGNDNVTYKAKFLLLKDLPAPILADINMLKSFGYKFKDEIPPLFRHKPQNDIEMKMKESSNKFKSIEMDIESNWNNLYQLSNKDKPHVNVINKLTICDKIKCLDSILFDDNSDKKFNTI